MIDELKNIIQQEVKQLICETHPEVCEMRDNNYSRLEKLVLDRLLEEQEEAISVQTALAEIETELGHLN